MSWDYVLSQGIDLFVEDRIDRAAAQRQRKSAAAILERLADQPGVVLADEVGMGKTFVALAVGVSIALINKELNPNAGPVVVMVPPSVKDKWPRDFGVFFDRCMKPLARAKVQGATRTIENGLDFLRVLDDPEEHKVEVVFLTHGALSHGLSDVWVKLALVKHVLAKRRMTEIRAVFPRFAGKLLWGGGRRITEELCELLLSRPPSAWRKHIEDAGVELDDDPVPQALYDSIDHLSTASVSAVAAALDEIPRRESASIDDRLSEARRLLSDAFRSIWGEWLAAACRQVQLPLLILDEAHHLKNDSTRLASLFRSEEASDDAALLAGPLNGVFERMLFLTATPFQLGHDELLNVLARFENISWKPPHAPAQTQEQFRDRMTALRRALDAAQLEAMGLDRAWGKLRREHLIDAQGAPQTPEQWWQETVGSSAELDGTVGDVLARYRATELAMRVAGEHLRPWVLRHLKPQNLPTTDLARRRLLPGASIADEGNARGLEVEGDALLPFLLAARAQASLAATQQGRALFAEGLASSFEAYRDTRSRDLAIDEDDEAGGASEVTQEVAWYLARIEQSLPRHADGARTCHPKMRATVDRVVDLWKRGEKSLIFCFYRATGKALERHISAELDLAINDLAAQRFQCDVRDALARMERIRKRLSDDDTFRARVDGALGAIVGRVGGLGADDRERVVEVMRRFWKTPSFLARFYPADDDSDAPLRALDSRDASGLTLDARFEAFCAFLAKRCTPEERVEYLNALAALQTGERYGREDLDGAKGPDAAKLLPNVRLANGETRDQTRRRLMLTFNTPFFPEILVASSVLAEGVDLHLDCRFIIHHDLCWNPSTLEQRTGRVDRIGAKAERAGAPIHVYEPYIAATQDEKMFRVVHDRQRWFQVVMGEKYQTDESSTDKQAERIPLPESVGAALAFRLGLEG